MKTALVTGGSRGIGRAIALELGKSCYVAVGYTSSKDSAEEVVGEIVKSGGEATAIQIDVTSSESIENAFTTIEKELNGVDILVNNAGITKDNILPRIKEDDWNDVINTNLTGSFKTSQRAIKHMMKNKWGRIVFISSIVGIVGNQGQANYAASKAGLIGMTKSVARELSSRGITANCVAPGYVETDMTNKLTDEIKSSLNEQIPLGRIGNVKDIAYAVAFLASDEASYITGQTLSVDGGMVM